MIFILEALFWVITCFLNWRMFFCVAATGGCGFLLIYQSNGQPWTWVMFSVLLVIGTIVGYLWEQSTDDVNWNTIPGATSSTSRTELLFADEAVLFCTPTLEQLLRGDIDIDRVRIRGLSLFPTRSRNGDWNIGGLIPATTSTSTPSESVRSSWVL